MITAQAFVYVCMIASLVVESVDLQICVYLLPNDAVLCFASSFLFGTRSDDVSVGEMFTRPLRSWWYVRSYTYVTVNFVLLEFMASSSRFQRQRLLHGCAL